MQQFNDVITILEDSGIKPLDVARSAFFFCEYTTDNERLKAEIVYISSHPSVVERDEVTLLLWGVIESLSPELATNTEKTTEKTTVSGKKTTASRKKV